MHHTHTHTHTCHIHYTHTHTHIHTHHLQHTHTHITCTTHTHTHTHTTNASHTHTHTHITHLSSFFLALLQQGGQLLVAPSQVSDFCAQLFHLPFKLVCDGLTLLLPPATHNLLSCMGMCTVFTLWCGSMCSSHSMDNMGLCEYSSHSVV